MALRAVADDGRLATITSDAPSPERAVTVSDVYVRPDGAQLSGLARYLGDGQLAISVAETYDLAAAAQALARVTGGHAAGAVVIEF
jgi:NADPH:quinone reductase-like Zn-dependent oxidoreductase